MMLSKAIAAFRNCHTLHFSAAADNDVFVYGVETMSLNTGVCVGPESYIRKEANHLFHIMLTALEAGSGRIRDFGLFGKPNAISMGACCI